LVTHEAGKATWSQPVLGLTPAQIAQALRPVSRLRGADDVVELGRRLLLRDAGLVTTSRRGRWIDYALAEDALDRLRAALPGITSLRS